MRIFVLAAALAAATAAVAGTGQSLVNNCAHGTPHSHGYGGTSGFDVNSQVLTLNTGHGSVTVHETNTADCNGDGFGLDFDGDYETGNGGGFFGYGPWANEPTCNYGLQLHGGVATVNDVVFGSDVWFLIGADDTSGPVVTFDATEGIQCTTDGTIAPGDPATDPTADADDCLSPLYQGTGVTCGAGGDGGYWVILTGANVAQGGSLSFTNPPTAGLITA